MVLQANHCVIAHVLHASICGEKREYPLTVPMRVAGDRLVPGEPPDAGGTTARYTAGWQDSDCRIDGGGRRAPSNHLSHPASTC